jgi:hypothetical protein
MSNVAGLPVLLAGLYLVGLGFVALISPRRARAFLSGFARSAFVHYLELCIRLVVGVALVSYGPQMKSPQLFTACGWIIVLTTLGLLVVPWRWHRRFAAWSVPYATRSMSIVAVGSLAAGIFVLVSLALGLGLAPLRGATGR